MPVPSACQIVPVQRAMYAVFMTLPASVNCPPAISAPLYTVSASTVLLHPRRSVLHAMPFHCATRFAAAPPAVVNAPPAIRFVLNTVSARTGPPTPLAAPTPIEAQFVPFHCATRFAALPPAVVKNPPAI